MNNRLLKITAIIEGLTGLGLMAVPGFIVHLLLNADIAGAAIPLGRVAGVALFALSVACWLASYDVQSRAGRGVVSAMAIYNFGAVLILGAAGLQMQPTGIALWPAVIIHVGMAIWCITAGGSNRV
jgi:hypothetical protein